MAATHTHEQAADIDDSDMDIPPTYEEAAALPANIDVTEDGRVQVDLSSRLSRTLSRCVHLPPAYSPVESPATRWSLDSQETLSHEAAFPLRLNIVIQAVGSRGDIQPFVALGSALKRHGHRVRLATHEAFRDFVQKAGLEFFCIGGDPEELMAYMVRNPGLLPSMRSLKAGDVTRKRTMIATILDGCWRSCIETDGEPFVADAIIANPPSFAHIHCAEALGIPLHMVFTMPWTGTRAFPHPLTNITNNRSDPKTANYVSYVVVEWLTWQGLGDIINTWRHGLDLPPVPLTEGPMLAETLKIPHTYCWSSALVPKPLDWPSHIDVSGFFFRDVPDYKPPEDLQAFLDAGPPPVYIGFGSIMLDDATEMSSIVLDAVQASGVRAIVSRGWSRLDGPERPDIFWLEECPHEWLFQRVFAVVHHGGAGTTACGLRFARPTFIVPFFGDQTFWGNMVASAGAGPEPVNHRHLDAKKLAGAIEFCQTKEAQSAALEIALRIEREDGVEAAVRSFHANLPLEAMRCNFLDNEPASFTLSVRGKPVKVSKKAAEVIVKNGAVDFKKFKSHKPKVILIDNRRWDPLTGVVSSFTGTLTEMVDASTGIFLKPAGVYRREKQQKAITTQSEPSSRAASPAQSITDAKVKTDGDSMMSTESSQSERQPSTIDAANLEVLQTGDEKSKSLHSARLAGNMALSSGKSLGKFFTSYTRGFIVDLPLATAEGFKNMPRLWGDDVKDYGQVTDWKSGGVVAGRSFVQGIGQGFVDVAMEPVKGGQQGGIWGAAKGVARGSASLITKSVSGGVGLVAYPGQGLVKSFHTLCHGRMGKAVLEAKRAECASLAASITAEERAAVVKAYMEMLRSKKVDAETVVSQEV